MVSKNNMGLLDEKNVDKKQRFSLRKFSVGVASVLIGTTFMATGQKALADSNSSTNQGAVEENTDQQPLASKGQVPLQQKQPTQQSTASQSESSQTTNTLNTATVDNQAAAAPNLSEMKASTNQNGTDQQAASLVQQQLGSNVEVQSDKVKTVTRTIHYEEQGTNTQLQPDDTQSVTFVPYYKKGQITIKYYDEDYKQYIPASVVPTRDKIGYVGQELNKGFIGDDITSIERIGYQYVSTSVPDSPTFTESPQTYRINFRRQTTPVSPDNPGALVTPDTPNPANPANSLFMVLAQTNSDGTGDPTTFYAIVQNGSMTKHDLSAGKVQDTLTQVIPPATLKGESLVDPTQTIPAYPVNLDSPNKEETVYYKKTDQTATIKYIDDTDSKTLAQDSAKGEVGTPISFTNSVGTEIANYEKQGYQFVKTNFSNNEYKSDNKQNQFEVHFKHQIKTVTDIDTVNETIHYVFADGSMAEPTHYASVNWTRDGQQDMTKVNEHDQGITWDTTSPKSFSEVPSPELTGYTPDPTSIDAVTVNFGDQDIDKTVTYNANKMPKLVTLTIRIIINF